MSKQLLDGIGLNVDCRPESTMLYFLTNGEETAYAWTR